MEACADTEASKQTLPASNMESVLFVMSDRDAFSCISLLVVSTHREQSGSSWGQVTSSRTLQLVSCIDPGVLRLQAQVSNLYV